MPDLTPDTREEHFLNGDDLTPETRREYFYAGKEDELIEISGDPDANKPQTREEWFIQKYRSGGEIVLEDITITENGEVTAPSGKAYKKITTEVPLPQDAYINKALSGLPQPIATFNDGQALPMSALKVSIEPIQEGSGDPSPSNVRPISGWDECNVSVCGKNKWNPNSTPTVSGIYNGWFIKKPNANDYISITLFDKGNDSDISGLYFGISDSGDSPGGSGVIWAITNGSISSSGQVSGNKNYVSIYPPTNESVEKLLNRFDVMVTLGYYEYPTTYEPYNGQTTTIPFTDAQGNPIEVYGGAVDVINGTSGNIEDRKKIVFDGSNDEEWTYYANNGGFYISAIPNNSAKKTTDIYMSNEYQWQGDGDTNSTSMTRDKSVYGQRAYGRFWVKDSDITTVEALRTFLSTHPLQIIYPLEDTTTFTTQPTAIKSLQGTNNIWADCGQISELEYWSKEV